MTFRPKCDFCQKKSDIFQKNNSGKKEYFCGGCYIKKKLHYETNNRHRDQWVSRQK